MGWRFLLLRFFLWVSVLAWGIVLGAKLFDLRVVAGAWSAAPSRITQPVAVWSSFSGQPRTILRTDFRDDPIGGIWCADRRVAHAES